MMAARVIPRGIASSLAVALMLALLLTATLIQGATPGPVFGFPYFYTPPVVPTTVGAQGATGSSALQVGPTGTAASMLPSGPVGPGSYTPGTPTATGTTPCGSAGCVTSVSVASYWGNETYSILGNVSITGAGSLTIDDSAVTFAEPATSTSWAYGFLGAGNLVIRNGANVSSTPASGRAWFLATLSTVTVANATLAEPSNHPGVVTGRGLNVSSLTNALYFGYGATTGAISLNISGTVLSSKVSNGTGSGATFANSIVTGSALTTRAPFTASRTLFSNSSVYYPSTVGPSGTVGNSTVWYSFLSLPPVAMYNVNLHPTTNYSIDPVDAMSLHGSSRLTHGFLSYVFPLRTSTGYYNSINAQVGFGFSVLNVSYSVVDFSDFPRKTVDLGGTQLWLYQSRLGANYTIPQEISISANVTTTLLLAGMVLVQPTKSFYANFTTFLGPGNLELWTGAGNATFAHDWWPWYVVGNAYAGFSFFTSVPHGYLPAVTLLDDRFGQVVYNETVFYNFQTRLYGPIGIVWLFDTNFSPYIPNTPLGTLGVNSTTFEATPLGRQHQFPPGDVVFGANGVTVWATNDLFENAVSSVVAPKTYQNGSYYTPLYAEDVIAAGGATHLTGDWFLGLSNLTAPIGENSGAQGSGAAPILTVSDLHFFYAPTSLETYVPPWNYALPAEGPSGAGAGTIHFLGTYPTNSSMTYEVPIDTNASLTLGVGEYLWNLSTLQTNGYIVGSWSTPNVYPWVVAPSASVFGGSLTLSYQGMGGPQPWILWQGHKYDLNISAAAVQVTADSTSAPAIQVAFNGTAGATYTVQAESGGYIFWTQPVVADSTGHVTVSYTPSSMPLTATFFDSFVGYPSTPAAFSLTSVVFGLPFYIWLTIAIVASIGVALGARKLRV